MDPQQKLPFSPYYYLSNTNLPDRLKPSLPPLRPKRRWPKVVEAVLSVAVALSAAYLVIHHDVKAAKINVHKTITAVTPTSPTAPAVPATPSLSASALHSMSSSINYVINQNNHIDISVSLIGLSDNQPENYGDDDPFTAASTTKVITAADFLHEVEEGQQSLTAYIDGLSAEYLLQQMIVVSNDAAWNNLRNVLGYQQIQSYADSIGLTSYQSTPNTVAASNMALLLEELYEGKLLNPNDTNLLLSYMKAANYRQFIVPVIPSNDTIYHKVGFYIDTVNEEAIITNGSKALVIVIFTNGNGHYDWSGRAQIMQEITQAALTAYL